MAHEKGICHRDLKLEDETFRAFRFREVVDGREVRMVERGNGLCLPVKARDATRAEGSTRTDAGQVQPVARPSARHTCCILAALSEPMKPTSRACSTVCT